MSSKRLRPAGATNIAGGTSIHDRPAEADGRRFGDRETGTIAGPYGHAILTLTERSTDFVLIEKLPHGRKAVPTAKAVVRLLFPYRESPGTITTDNGCGFAAHLEITGGTEPQGKESHSLFCRFLLFLAEVGYRECKQAYTKVHT